MMLAVTCKYQTLEEGSRCIFFMVSGTGTGSAPCKDKADMMFCRLFYVFNAQSTREVRTIEAEHKNMNPHTDSVCKLCHYTVNIAGMVHLREFRDIREKLLKKQK